MQAKLDPKCINFRYILQSVKTVGYAELPRLREYNIVLVSRVRDSKSSTKLGTSLKTVIVEVAGLIGLLGLIAKPAELELELEYITARDGAYGRPKRTDTLKFSSSKR